MFSVTVETVPATSCSRVILVEAERSRKVDAETPMVECEKNGIDAENTGNLAVVVFDALPPLVIFLNSGSYCRNMRGSPVSAIEAGFIGLSASNSEIAPPVARARVLIWPGGYPKPCVLSVPCAAIPENGATIRTAAIRYACFVTGAPSIFWMNN